MACLILISIFRSLLVGLTIANIIPIMMLGRKQSLKGEPVLADYGPEESLNESADIEWVNKVNGTMDWSRGKWENANSKSIVSLSSVLFWKLFYISVMGEKVDAILRPGVVDFRLLEHPENIWESTIPSIRYLYLRSDSHVSVYRWNDRQNAYTRNTEGEVFIKKNIEIYNWDLKSLRISIRIFLLQYQHYKLKNFYATTFNINSNKIVNEIAEG